MPGSYERLTLKFLVQRDIFSYLVQVYWPTVLTTAASWVSFWMNYECPVARVTVGRSFPTPTPERSLLGPPSSEKKLRGREEYWEHCDCTGKQMRWGQPHRHADRCSAILHQRGQRWRQVRKKNSGLDLRYVGPEVPEFIIFWIHNKWMEKSVINIDRKCNKTNVEEELIQIPYQAAENFQRSCFR